MRALINHLQQRSPGALVTPLSCIFTLSTHDASGCRCWPCVNSADFSSRWITSLFGGPYAFHPEDELACSLGSGKFGNLFLIHTSLFFAAGTSAFLRFPERFYPGNCLRSLKDLLAQGFSDRSACGPGNYCSLK